jgi:hypothetical protein
MSKFTIITRGIAASYMKDDVWKLIFPFNECHRLRLQVGGAQAANNTGGVGDTSGIVLGQRGVNIEIGVTDPQSSTAEGDDYHDFVDLTGEGAHDALTPRFPMDEMNAVLMTIANAEFSVLDHIDRGYRLVNPNGAESSAPFQKIGNCGKACLEGGELTVRVTGLEGGSFSMVFPDDATIIFDNDCYEQPMSKKGDLEMIYDILCDADRETTRFVLEGEPVAIEPVTAAVGAGTAGLSPENPTTPNPAIDGGDGLPCNKYRISNPRTLP